MESLASQTAVLTGASSGIGRAIALRLAEQGVRLHLLGRDRTRLQEVADRVKALGGQADTHRLELTDDGEVKRLGEVLAREVTGVDILVHSAGVIALAPLERAPVADLDWHYRVNLRAPYLLTQTLLPLVRRAKGQVVFINSGAGLHARAEWGQYAISKHGLKALADSFREEVRPDGVRVISIYPGRTASPMQAEVHRMEGRAYDADRFVQPDDLARQVVGVLALPRTAEITDLSIRPG